MRIDESSHDIYQKSHGNDCTPETAFWRPCLRIPHHRAHLGRLGSRHAGDESTMVWRDSALLQRRKRLGSTNKSRLCTSKRMGYGASVRWCLQYRFRYEHFLKGREAERLSGKLSPKGIFIGWRYLVSPYQLNDFSSCVFTFSMEWSSKIHWSLGIWRQRMLGRFQLGSHDYFVRICFP